MHRIIKYILLIVLLVYFIPLPGSAEEKPEKRLQRRVAVFTFEDKTAHNYHWWTGQPVGEGMADMLITELVKSGKYKVLERTEMEKILNEQSLSMSGIVTPQSAAQAGNMLGVELAIMGSVTEFGWARGSKDVQIKGFGLGVASSSATVAVDVRFVNTTTGEIVSAENVRKEKSKKGLKVNTDDVNFNNQNDFDESLVGKATREAIGQLVQMLDTALTSLPWQAKIIKGTPDIFINVGSEAGVGVGDVLVVYRAGEELVDPDTGLSLGSVETKIGTIRVVDNTLGNGKASKCVAIEGSQFNRNDIVRAK